ncbi:MAG: DMT family transporter [Clostridiales bacterium]|uniref:DMT family transporter n=1 Tax=Terrisporobacter sp. TaxID=1965305 RepID=UPI002A4EE83C|nr:DMT family transporter [Terrisporobacter sp.]MCI7207839.1 DMT family transporter [Clostridium sp.]MDD7755089.1 DMT family transporter [Clostridiales bacterium]MDY4135807.1 DMT family transporter [Terrisporobacter sp.]
MKKSYHFYAIITIIFWALAFVFTRLGLQYFDVYSLSFLRYLVASITLLVIICFIKINRPKKEDLFSFILSGALGFFLYVILFNKGTALVSAATSSIIIATVPVFTALLATFFYKEKLKIYQWIAIGIEFMGILVLTLMNGSFSINEGVLWLLIAALCLASYNILQRKLTKTYSALQASTYSIFFATIMLCIFLPGSINKAIHAPLIQMLYVLILGVFSSAIAYIAWAKAISLAEKTTYVSNYMFVTPFLTTILGFIMINEIPDKATILGGIIILSGLFIFNKESFLEPFKNKKLSSNDCANCTDDDI